MPPCGDGVNQALFSEMPLSGAHSEKVRRALLEKGLNPLLVLVSLSNQSHVRRHQVQTGPQVRALALVNQALGQSHGAAGTDGQT